MFQTFVLALIQSLSEFLPISSSGHLILIPLLLHWPHQSIIMDINLHLGTLFAVCVYFRKDVASLISALLGKGKSKKLLTNLFIASLPIPIIGLCFISFWRLFRQQPIIMAGMLIFFGVVLWIVDKFSPSDDKKELSKISVYKIL